MKEAKTKSVLKEYLEKTFIIDKSMKSKEQQIQQLRDMQIRVNNSLLPDKVQTSPKHDKLEKLIADIVDIENEYLDDIEKLAQAKRDIKRVIDMVNDLTYFLILEERYVNVKEWKDIAADNDYSERQVFNLHGEALKELADCILLKYLRME